MVASRADPLPDFISMRKSVAPWSAVLMLLQLFIAERVDAAGHCIAVLSFRITFLLLLLLLTTCFLHLVRILRPDVKIVIEQPSSSFMFKLDVFQENGSDQASDMDGMGRADTNGNGLAAMTHAHPGIPREAPGSQRPRIDTQWKKSHPETFHCFLHSPIFCGNGIMEHFRGGRVWLGADWHFDLMI